MPRGKGESPKSEVRRPKARPKSAGRDPAHDFAKQVPPIPLLLAGARPVRLGLMSKPMLVTVPFVLLLLDYWPLRALCSPRPEVQRPRVPAVTASPPAALRGSSPRSPRSPRCSWEKVPFLLLSAASCVVTFRVQQSGGTGAGCEQPSHRRACGNALMSYVRYLGKMVWPEHLAALYLRKAPWPAWEVGLAALALVAASAAVIRLARRRPYLAVGWFWYVGTLVPVIGLVQVGMQTMADRYTYIPLIGIFIALAWGGWELAGRCRTPRLPRGGLVWRPRWCWPPACADTKQVSCWQDSETLFSG